MLYISICIFVCFVLYCICKPEININYFHHYYNEVEEASLAYQKEKDIKQEAALHLARELDLKRLEDEEKQQKSVLDTLKNMNTYFTEGE